VFEGKLANQTRCLWCENTTNREECFLDLSVDVAQNTSITACLNNFSAKELLDKNDKFQCDRCGGLHEAQKRMLIQSAPRVLSLHLKRFKYIETLGRHAKLNHRVVFSSELKIPNLVDEAEHPDASYDLFAVVVHIGSGPNHGHYVCFAKNNNRWFLFDDDCVEVVDEEQLHRVFGSTTEAGGAGSEHGYMLFFARNEKDTDDAAEGIPFTMQ
jgi:ubiquitin carboxyl-terminal hydrolase 12/46